MKAKHAWSFIVALLLGAICFFAISAFRKADRVAKSSAERALAAEIDQHLTMVAEGGQFPDSLSELPLTYPDGGDSSMLKIFDYQSSGTKCVLRYRFTDFSTQEVVKYYPQ